MQLLMVGYQFLCTTITIMDHCAISIEEKKIVELTIIYIITICIDSAITIKKNHLQTESYN